MNDKNAIQIAIMQHMNYVKNPLCTVHEITKVLTGRYTDSNDIDYRKTYRTLERMTKERLLFSRSTVNGGNVYISRARVLSFSGYKPVENGGDDGLPF